MSSSLSPLRYPGGKTKIYKNVKRLIEKNCFNDRLYIEPFAGGFGVGIALLEEGIIQRAVLNEYDKHVYNFWLAVFEHTDELIRLIEKTDISMNERNRQKEIYSYSESVLEDGFATLFLNRVNYSGILFGGPIGGKNQTGKYLLDCRFNKQKIVRRIEAIAPFKDYVRLYNLDAIDLIDNTLSQEHKRLFYNIDPPYVIKGKSLYTKYYKEEDHIKLKETIDKELIDSPWIITYDNCDMIKNLYLDYFIQEYDMYHSVHNRVVGKELVITNIPKESFIW